MSRTCTDYRGCPVPHTYHHRCETCHTHCVDCDSQVIAVYWGGGARCKPCSDKHEAIVLAKRQAELNAERERVRNHKCGADTDDLCEDCCEHLDIERDERCCLDCGKDLTEHLSGLAYDRYKDFRKFGDI